MCDIKNATTATSNGLRDNGSTSGILTDRNLFPNVGRRGITQIATGKALFKAPLPWPLPSSLMRLGSLQWGPFLVASNAPWVPR